MIALSTMAALALLGARPTVQSVVLERDTARPTLTIAASAPLATPEARRREGTLTLTWDADLAPGTVPPTAQPPIRGIVLSPRDGRVVLELLVDPAVPYGVESDGARVRVTFGAPPPPASDVATLWATLFPAVSEPEPIEPASAEASEPSATDDGEGLSIGRVRLRPALEALYISADSTFESPEPIHDDYFELRPRVAALAPVAQGALNVDYEVRWRRASAFPESEQASHFLNGALEMPVGSRVTMHVADHFAVGTLETREVDPGGEYFFGLGRFQRNRFGVQARLQTAGRIRVEGAMAWETLDVDDDAAFFDYDRSVAEARVGYELAPRLVATVGFAHENIPTPAERPIAKSSANALGVELQGDLGPLTVVEIGVGVRDQETPLAAEGGREFTGVVVGARLRRQLGPESSLQVLASRATFPSDFQGNAFYLASGVGAEVEVPAPAELVLRLAAGYHWNDYRTTAASLDEPRRDRIWDGAIGLSRPLTRLAWIRADYRRERRDSNLDAFDVTTDAFAIQVGIGFLGPRR